MVLLRFIFMAMIFWPVGQNSSSQNLQGDLRMPCSADNEHFLPSEYLRYTVYYNLNFIWIPAGEVEFTVTETDSTYAYSAVGKTYPSYEWFYKVEDTFNAEADKKSLLPIRASRQVYEGGYTKSESVEFKQEENIAISDLTRKGENKGTKEVDTKGCIQDVLSALYFLRNQPIHTMEKGQKFGMRVYLDQEIYDNGVFFAGRRKKKVKGIGKCETYLLQPELIDGEVFKEGDEMKVYVSTDDNLLPLLVESPVIVGSVKAVLSEYENLKFPLNY